MARNDAQRQRRSVGRSVSVPSQRTKRANAQARALARRVWANAKDYVRLEGGRYLRLKRLEEKHGRLVGVVVHDEAKAIGKSLARYRRQGKRIGTRARFGARVVQKGGRCVLLVRTGMGCTGSSIVVYELALLEHAVPVLKVGTCVSMWGKRRGHGVGTVLMPQWAVADEGVTDWDGRVLYPGSGQPAGLASVFTNRRVVGADRALRKSWKNHLRGKLKRFAKRGAIFARDESAVWSADAFYPLLLRPDLIADLAKGHRVVLAGQEPCTKVASIGRGRQGQRLLAWDMECSALFSAGIATGLKVAAALAVSWTTAHWTNIGNCGDPSRGSEQKRLAHAVEHTLVNQAIRFLFS